MTARVSWDAGDGHAYVTPGIAIVFFTIGNRVFKLSADQAREIARDLNASAAQVEKESGAVPPEDL